MGESELNSGRDRPRDSRESLRARIVQEVHREFLEAGKLSLPPDDISGDADHEFWKEVERRLAARDDG